MVKIIVNNELEITAKDYLDAIKKLLDLEMNSKNSVNIKNILRQIIENPLIKVSKLIIPDREFRNAR